MGPLPHRPLLWRPILVAGVFLLCAAPGWGAEPMQQFVEGLRARGYYETALTYLDEMAEKDSLPAELKLLVPYERAQTLLTSAREQINSDDQRAQLDAAEAAFQLFAKNAPSHPLAAQANTWRGRILFEKARVEIFESEDPSHLAEKAEFQTKARGFLTESRKVFEAATTLNKKSLDQFPTFIPEGEKNKQQARTKAENTYIEVVFDMAKCNYWEARTYDRGSPEAVEALNKASAEFTNMYNQTRNNTGGKFARLWQGKCFEELGQITQALGVYDDLLTLTPDTQVKAAIYDLALRFKLICLNHEQKKDYPLAVTLGSEWLANFKGRTRTEVGHGILWETCRALEQIGIDTARSDDERTNALNQALTRVRTLSQAAGEFKAPSNAMIQRLLLALNRNENVPTDFDSAYGMASKLQEDIRKASLQLAAAQLAGKNDEARAKQAEMRASAAEMTKLCDFALKHSLSITDPGDIYRANVLLAYGYLLDDRWLEAAAIGEYLMRRYAHKSPENAKNAGLIAMLAFDRAYQQGDTANREFEYRKLIEFANRLEEKFPQSDQANDARLSVARIMWDERRLDEAAAWWNKIPVGSTHYAGAQLSTGQAFWAQYTTQINRPEDKRPSIEKLNEWKAAAIRHLEIGIAEKMRSTPATSASPDDLIRGKLTLAQIRNLSGNYRTREGTVGSIELLTVDPHSVIEAIRVPEGTERPKSSSSPKSSVMASFALQQLLKAQIGSKDMESARETRFRLEEVAGTGDAEALTQIYVEFGQELENELKQLKAAGEKNRADEVRAGFEEFLNDLFSREEGQSFTSLFWIAETFTSLGESDPANAKDFFTKAGNAYQKIIDKAKADPAFAQPDQLLYSKMRLVNCQQAQGDFTNAESLLKQLLKEKKAADSPTLQFTAAQLYQAWAASEQGAWKRYQIAINGSTAPVKIWGWAHTAQRLQSIQQRKGPDSRLAKMEFDARYNLGLCQLEYARQQPNVADRNTILSQAKKAIETFAYISTSLPPEEYERFNTLFRDIQQEGGSLPKDLVIGKPAVKPKPGEKVIDPPTPDPEETVVAPPEATPQPQPSSNTGVMLLLGLVGIGAIVGILYLSKRKRRGRYQSTRSVTSVGAATAPTAAAPTATAPPRPTPVKPRPQPRPAASPVGDRVPAELQPPKPTPTRLPGKPNPSPSE